MFSALHSALHDAQLGYVQVSFAQGFSVEYHDSYKVRLMHSLRVGSTFWQVWLTACGAQIVRNSQVNETYVLYQCGLAAPSNAALPAGAKLFSIPLTAVSVGDTTPLGYMVRLPPTASLGLHACCPCSACWLAADTNNQPKDSSGHACADHLGLFVLSSTLYYMVSEVRPMHELLIYRKLTHNPDAFDCRTCWA